APATEWGLIISPEGDDGTAVSVLLNGKGELEVRPFVALTKKQGAPPPALRGFQVGPLSHRAIKAGSEFNKLLAVLRGRQLQLFVNGVAVCDPIALAPALAPAKLRV